MISIYSKKYFKNSIIIFLLTFLLIFILLSIDKIFGINKLFLFVKFNLIIIILSILHILILKKKYPTIYVAGEMLNIDGVTGGFNFQSAWTTAWFAANSIAIKL